MERQGDHYRKKLREKGVPQIPEDVHRTLQRGYEPTREQERRAALAIRRACRMIRQLHCLQVQNDGHEDEER